MNLRELSLKNERFAGGHRLCPGCPEGIIVRAITKATDKQIVAATATGCLEVSSSIFPYSSWKVPWIHNAFENVSATISGIEAAYKVARKKGDVTKDVKFVAFGGDGATYDIGIQSLSGALERGHEFVYVCLDNEGYMNTGIQRSSSTPYGAWTNTTQVGKAHVGKEQFRKDITAIVAAHNIPYVAQASPSHYMDLMKKAEKAFETKGPAFINVMSPCVPGWKYPQNMSVKMAKLAVETCFWPLFEVENGEWKLNYDPGENKKPITEWIKPQGRFRHLLVPENKHIVDELQKNVDERWEQLKKRCGICKV